MSNQINPLFGRHFALYLLPHTGLQPTPRHPDGHPPFPGAILPATFSSGAPMPDQPGAWLANLTVVIGDGPHAGRRFTFSDVNDLETNGYYCLREQLPEAAQRAATH